MNDEPNTSTRFRILSLDGGGAKGFYTLGVLSEIEAMAKRPLYECFDLIFGTSTGAIIAALLARGETVAGVKLLYKQHVPTIMKEHSAKGRTRALHSLAKSVFGDEGCAVFKTLIGIVATNWDDEQPLIFKTSVDQTHGSKGSFEPFFGVSVADAVIASCSAYPFFETHTITKGNGDVLRVGDGGFCANNPSLYAVAEATLALKRAHSDLRVVSLGVGSYSSPGIWKQAGRVLRSWALMRHASSSDFLQKVLETNTRSMEVLHRVLFKEIQTVRINEHFSEPAMATDLLEHDLSKLNRLIQKGRYSFAAYEESLRKFLEL